MRSKGARIHQQGLAGYERRALRTEEDDAVRDLVGGASMGERRAVLDALDERRVRLPGSCGP